VVVSKGFMRSFLLTAASTCLMFASAVSAQTVSEAQMRAANLARMQAEIVNGGLGRYSPADCMHQGGGADCLVSNTAEGYRFRFLGGVPGWSARREPATLETVVLISPDGKISKVEYNGPVRIRLN
jgi:opacity protein-like surface antigen